MKSIKKMSDVKNENIKLTISAKCNKNIVYVSCNPNTLDKNLDILKERNNVEK